MDIRLIKLFKVALVDDTKMDESKVISAAAQVGYLVHPNCCTQSVLDFVRSQKMNINSTFYKTWKDVTDKSRMELFIDQCLHYASTYGTDFQGEVYCPNGEPIDINYKLYELILPVTREELYERCMGMLQSGIALSSDTLDALCKFVITCVQKYKFCIDLDSIKNRDAMVLLSVSLGLYPTDGQSIVRVLYFKLFDNPMMIMGKSQMQALYRTFDRNKFFKLKFTDKQMVALSQVFLRYKKFLLAFRTNPANKPVLNKLRNLAKKNHKPMTVGFWERITNEEYLHPEELAREINKLDNNFKIVRLIQMFKMRKLQNSSGSRRMFTIRNGKLWVDRTDTIVPYNTDWNEIYAALIGKLILNMRAKLQEAKNGSQFLIKFPKELELTCPVSEKMFCGNVPFGSSLRMRDKDTYFGVYWRGQWGVQDYDLSYLCADGTKIGWNADYSKKGQLTYSGDMTSAHPQASEMIWAQGCGVPNGIIKLNRYSGDEGAKFRLFFAQAHNTDKLAEKFWSRGGGMCDPNDIIFTEDGESLSREQMLGAVVNNRFYFNVVRTGDSRVSMDDKSLFETYMDAARSFLPLKPVLLGAGAFEYTNEHAELGFEPDLDLTDLKKDTLIQLFS